MANDLLRWDPMDELRQMRRWMDRLAPAPVRREEIEFGGLDEALPVDIYEKDDQIVVKTALPGVDPKDIQVDVTDGVLHIRAETKAEQDVNDADYHRREYRYGRFSRAFRLPPNVDTKAAKARFEHGMLRLAFPKVQKEQAQSIKLEVK
jgi:HSP20 family protein